MNASLTFVWLVAESIFDLLTNYCIEHYVFGLKKRKPTIRVIAIVAIYSMIIVGYFYTVIYKVSPLGFAFLILFLIKPYFLIDEFLVISDKFETVLNIILLYLVARIGGQTLDLLFNSSEMKSDMTYLYRALFSLGLFLLVVAVAINRKLKKVSVYIKTMPKFLYFIVIANIFCLGMLEAGLFGDGSGDWSLSIFLLKAVWVVFFPLMVILVVKIFGINKDKVFKDRVADELKEQMQVLTEYYEEIGKKERKLNAFKHDMNNSLIALKTMIDNDDLEGVNKYIEGINSACNQIVKRFNTGSYVADAILSVKANVAESRGQVIVCEGQMPHAGIDNTDICIMLANGLDNALEACEQLGSGCKIFVHSEVVNNLWHFSIENPCREIMEVVDNRIETTKKDKALHGYGLRNMEDAAKKYNGTMRIENDEGRFLVEFFVQLNME